MGKLPWMKFFPADWKHDTRCLTPHTRGVWIDLICTLWPNGTKTLPRSNWLRELSVTEEEFTSALHEIHAFSIADIQECNGSVTVSSRRIQHDSNTREQTRKRVDKLRRNANVTRSVTTEKRVEARSQKLEVRDQKLEARGQRPEEREASDKIPSDGQKLPALVPMKSSACWESYAMAYALRYKAVPVRNAGVNAMLCKLVEKLGAVEAPQVAGFFLTHNAPFYVAKMHPVNLLLTDAEKLRTEWATNTKMTSGTSKNAEHQDDAKAQVKRVEAMLKGGAL